MGGTGERKGSGLKRGHLTREKHPIWGTSPSLTKGFDALSSARLGKRLGASLLFYRHIL